MGKMICGNFIVLTCLSQSFGFVLATNPENLADHLSTGTKYIRVKKHRFLTDHVLLPAFGETEDIELYHLRSFPRLAVVSVAGSFSVQTSGLALRSADDPDALLVLEYEPMNYSACFLPLLDNRNHSLVWDTRSKISFARELDIMYWQQSTFLGRVNGVVYMNYIQWIADYLRKFSSFVPLSICSGVDPLSCFTFAQTWDNFVSDSLTVFSELAVQMHAILPPRGSEIQLLSHLEPALFTPAEAPLSVTEIDTTLTAFKPGSRRSLSQPKNPSSIRAIDSTDTQPTPEHRNETVSTPSISPTLDQHDHSTELVPSSTPPSLLLSSSPTATASLLSSAPNSTDETGSADEPSTHPTTLEPSSSEPTTLEPSSPTFVPSFTPSSMGSDNAPGSSLQPTSYDTNTQNHYYKNNESVYFNTTTIATSFLHNISIIRVNITNSTNSSGDTDDVWEAEIPVLKNLPELSYRANVTHRDVFDYYVSLIACMQAYQLETYSSALRSCMNERNVAFVHSGGNRGGAGAIDSEDPAAGGDSGKTSNSLSRRLRGAVIQHQKQRQVSGFLEYGERVDVYLPRARSVSASIVNSVLYSPSSPIAPSYSPFTPTTSVDSVDSGSADATTSAVLPALNLGVSGIEDADENRLIDETRELRDRYYQIRPRHPFVYVRHFLQSIPAARTQPDPGTDAVDVAIGALLLCAAALAFVASMLKLNMCEWFVVRALEMRRRYGTRIAPGARAAGSGALWARGDSIEKRAGDEASRSIMHGVNGDANLVLKGLLSADVDSSSNRGSEGESEVEDDQGEEELKKTPGLQQNANVSVSAECDTGVSSSLVVTALDATATVSLFQRRGSRSRASSSSRKNGNNNNGAVEGYTVTRSRTSSSSSEHQQPYHVDYISVINLSTFHDATTTSAAVYGDDSVLPSALSSSSSPGVALGRAAITSIGRNDDRQVTNASCSSRSRHAAGVLHPSAYNPISRYEE